jgi:hypothetical protein
VYLRKHDTPSGFVCWPAPPLGGAFLLGNQLEIMAEARDKIQELDLMESV